jgi:hypothetical protein
MGETAMMSGDYLSEERAKWWMKACADGPNARVHHSPGTVFEMAALFLAHSGLLSMEDSAKLDDEWCKGAVAEAQKALPENPRCAAESSEDRFWNAVKEIARSR